MPEVQIEVRRSYTQAQEEALIEAVHNALLEGFKIPKWDRNVRLIVHEPHRFQVSPKLSQPESFTLVTIDAFAGRSLEAKRALYAAIVRNVGELGVPADHILILVREGPLENWGVRAGVPASDIDLGFKVDV